MSQDITDNTPSKRLVYPVPHYSKKKQKRIVLVVPRTGLEPACLSTHAPETCASTIPPPGHYGLSTFAQQTLEPKTRLELATLTLERLCTTNRAISAFSLMEMRLELTRHNCHYPLKEASLPIPPFPRQSFKICAQNRTRTCMPLATRT